MDIKVPQLGESITEATIGKWLKKVGDQVAQDEVVAELETDKVAMEVNAPSAGVLSEVVAKEGDTVEIGALIGVIDESGKAASKPAAKPEKQKPEPKEALVDVTVPQLGESITEAVIGKWLKKEGDAVAQDEAIAELETDKVAMEVNAPASGTLAKVKAKEGDTVEIGALIAQIDPSGDATATSTKEDVSAPPSQPAGDDADEEGPMSPAVRRLIADHDLDASKIKGSGKDGRLTKGDVLAAVDAGTAKKVTSAPAAKPQSPAAQPAEALEERVRMTRLRKRIAERLKEAQNTAAMLTTFNEVDMSAVMEYRAKYKDMFEKKHGIKLGFMSFFVKACVHALKEIPAVNAMIDGDEIVYKNYYDIGVAVSAPNGLVVPVVRRAENLSFAGCELAIVDLGRRARDGKLELSELQGGSFTITNGGIFGSLMSTPILNPPQSGILGMHKIQERPVAINGKVEIRPMMYIALSYDHRLIDGREAVTFLVRVKDMLEDPGRLLVDL